LCRHSGVNAISSGCKASVTSANRVTIKGLHGVAYFGGTMNERPAARPSPNEKLVRVFDTEQESEAMVVHGLLESSGIDSDVTSLDAQQDILPGVGGTVILVREEDADEAKNVIEAYRRAPSSDETAEIDISGLAQEEEEEEEKG
jgi:hypothetical protein